ncbi:unnamed protein product [Rhizophagus irregularis]|nr:unnamed protein product [Rhizophagus irregularis]CAB4411459.1 unnamed protein product [Rhizophagus irregularis]
MFNYTAINRRKDFTQYTYLSIVHKYYLFFMLIYYYGVVACEADWPDTYNVNRYVQNSKFNESKDAHELLSNYKRFPTWMWRNYQLCLFRSFRLIDRILLFCNLFRVAPSCEKEAVRVLADMVKRWARFKKQLGDDEIDELLAAEINAMVVKDSEEYYRTMIGAGTKSWNLRDSHMLRMLEALMKYLERQRPTIVTSETRDTHKGKLRKEWNIGQLARERFGMDKGYNIGFTTHNGFGKQT